MITILAGGTGSVKLVRGLAQVSKDVVVICNVGDNIWLYGLYVCPDIDTVAYGLAGVLDLKKGWGIKGDTFSFLGQVKSMGLPAWFRLGDRDLATHLYRTERLQRGERLTEVTGSIARILCVSSEILPATDDEVETIISTSRGKMHLQEFWVKHGAKPSVSGVNFKGVDRARPTRKVVDAIRNSNRIVIAPANPVSSIGPMLAIPGIRRALQSAREKTVAVSPIIGSRPFSGPAAKYMKALGLGISPSGVAEYYKDVAGSLVISRSDGKMTRSIERFGMNVLETDIMMEGRASEKKLAQYLIRKGQN